jgi:thiamine transport system ATP-binding protein
MTVVVDTVSVTFGDRRVLDRVSLRVGTGSIVGLTGPSGSGKSTLLRVIAGLLQPDGGRVEIDGVDVTPTPAYRRNVGMVFQDHALFPHLNVGENVAFGLKMLGRSRQERQNRVEELLALVGLAGLNDRAIGGLSGGESQRVALARALAPRPQVLLLDEPLSALDAETHHRLTLDLGRVLRAEQVTAVHVTHDQDEAAQLCDSVTDLSELTNRR